MYVEDPLLLLEDGFVDESADFGRFLTRTPLPPPTARFFVPVTPTVLVVAVDVAAFDCVGKAILDFDTFPIIDVLTSCIDAPTICCEAIPFPSDIDIEPGGGFGSPGANADEVFSMEVAVNVSGFTPVPGGNGLLVKFPCCSCGDDLGRFFLRSSSGS